MSASDIDQLRASIASVDKEIVALVAKRMHLSGQIGLEKKIAGVPVRAADVEEQVAARIQRECATRDIGDSFAAKLSEALIAESVRHQESMRLPKPLHRRVLVVGGAGQMGAWLCRYLRSRGYEVVVNDPAGPLEGYASEPDLAEGVASADVVAVSVPMSVSASVLESIAAVKPKGLVFDVCSLKAPVEPVLRSMGKAGLKVASVHPMFGPALWPLSSGNILFSDCGNGVAVLEAKELFRPSGAALLDVSLDHHDEMMAVLLGTSHLTLLSFARAAAESPFDLAGLRRPAGTTFSRLSVAVQGLLADPPELLRDIQALNPHTPEVQRRLRAAMDAWARAVSDSDGKEFVRLVQQARAYFGGPSP